MNAEVTFRERIANFLTGAKPIVAAPSTNASLFTEQATNLWLQWLTVVADPDEVLKKAGVTRPMLRALTGDDDITAALDTRREALLSTDWHLEPRPDTPEEPSKFVEEQLEPHMEKVLRCAMEALAYGYSVQEAIYLVTEDGRIGISEITEKPFEWFIPKLDGTVLWRSFRAPQGEITDPRKYFLTARAATYRNPYGEALFSRLYWPWLFRTNGWKFWVRWLERFGNPFVVGMTMGDAKVMSAALAQASKSATIAVGAGDKVEVVGASGAGDQFEKFERSVIGRYQRLILGQTLTSDTGGGSGASGSFALGKVHNEVRMDRRDADCRMCRGTGQKIVDVLWTLNAFDGSPPEFCMQNDTGLELERAERDSLLVKSGAVKLTPEYFSRVYDFEEGDIDVEGMAAAAAAAQALGSATNDGGNPAPGGSSEPKSKGPNDNGGPAQQDKGKRMRQIKNAVATLFGTRYQPNQQVIEDQVAAILPELDSPISNEAMWDAIKGARTPHELSQRLAPLFAGKSVHDFSDALGRSLYVAELMGYLHAEKETE